MKEYSQIQNFISVLMIFILLAYLSGCVSSRIITLSSDIPVSGKYYYIIHSQNSKYLLENAVISNGILSGKINKGESSHLGSKVHIYLSTDSVIKINTEKTLSIPLDGIAKVEIVKIATGKTILLVIGSTLGLILLIGGLSFQGIDSF